MKTPQGLPKNSNIEIQLFGKLFVEALKISAFYPTAPLTVILLIIEKAESSPHQIREIRRLRFGHTVKEIYAVNVVLSSVGCGLKEQ